MLAISLLGAPQFTLNGVPVTDFVSHKASALLAYLAVESEFSHNRTTLAEIFWPNQSEKVSRKNLRDILFNLQKALHNQDANPPFLLITRQTVQFNPGSAHTLDVMEFAKLLTACDVHRHKKMETCHSCAQRQETAVALYRGEFLSGTFVPDSNVFEHWLTINRERWRQMVLQALHEQVRYLARRQKYAAARRYAQRQVELAPWLESGYQQLMALSALAGQRGAALAQFETCRQRLLTELDVPPGPETMALYRQIKTGERPLTTSAIPTIPDPPYQIPGQTTSFLGREQEMLAIADHLQDPECRLLTLTGPGGSGKTRLAIQAATEEIANFNHGVFFISLTAVESIESLPLALAEGLNLKLAGSKTPETQLLNYLRNKEMLLVLDNFESLLGNDQSASAAEFLAAILQDAPQVVLLITSRQPAGLQAERIFELDGLSYPDANHDAQVERSGAVQLFLERVRRIRPKFSLVTEGLAAVAQICRMVEGLPLGIELAAAGARQMSCPEILARMRQSLDTLATEMPDVPVRHRSIRATFAYSWAMLSPAEQQAFCDLSVFRGGFTIDAAPTDRQVLSALVDKSLVRREENGRYHIHELLRQFGVEQLRQNPEAEQSARHFHSRWVASFLEKRGPDLQGKEQLTALSQIRDEIENVRAGWQWAVAQKDETALRQGIMPLSLFYDIRGWFQEGMEVFGEAAAALEGTGVLYGRFLAHYAAFAFRIGNYDLAQELFLQSKSEFLKHQATEQMAFVHNGLGAIAMFRGQHQDAIKHAQDSLVISRETGNLYEQAKSLDLLGVVARYEGRLNEAKPYFQASIEIYEKLGNQFGLARCYNYLGNFAFSEKDYEGALEIFSKAIAISRDLDYKLLLAYLLNNQANATSLLGNHQEALKYFRESLILFEDLGDQFGIAMTENNLGYIFILMEDGTNAKGHLFKALQFGLEMSSWALVLEAAANVASLLALAGKNAEALKLAALVFNHANAREDTKQKAKVLASKINKDFVIEQPDNTQNEGESLTLAELSEIALRGLA